MTESMLLGSEFPLYQEFDAALVDLDGVAYRGPHAIPTAPPALKAARDMGMKLIFVTNNASREPGEVASHLSELGIPTSDDEVLTSAQAVATLMAEQLPAGSRVLVVGGRGLVTAVTGAGFTVVASANDVPDAVVQGFDPTVSWRELAEAAYAVRNGATYFASNLDLSIPNERGIAPGNGSLVQAVVNATGVVPVAAGKPEPTMFELAAIRIGAKRPLAIGDRLDTDLQGARSAGVPGLHVLTGVSSALDAALAAPQMRPSFIGEDLRSLAEAHPKPARNGNTWTVGDATAMVESERIVFGGPAGINRVRAGCAATWWANDNGGTIGAGGLTELAVGFAHE